MSAKRWHSVFAEFMPKQMFLKRRWRIENSGYTDYCIRHWRHVVKQNMRSFQSYTKRSSSSLNEHHEIAYDIKIAMSDALFLT